jgi:hypothetical protein
MIRKLPAKIACRVEAAALGLKRKRDSRDHILFPFRDTNTRVSHSVLSYSDLSPTMQQRGMLRDNHKVTQFSTSTMLWNPVNQERLQTRR